VAYGISINNNNGKLVFSSDGLTLGYLGLATHVSTTQPDTTAGFGVAGYSTYTFTHSGGIMPVIRLESNRLSYLRSMSQSGSTWTITVYHGSTPTIDSWFDTQYQASVYVWGVPVSVSGYGLAIRDASGNLTGDLSKRPLEFKQKISWSDTTVSEAISGTITTPAIVGGLYDYQRIVTGSGVYQINYKAGTWSGAAGANLTRNWSTLERAQEDSPMGGSTTNRRAATAFLVDVNGLT